MSGKSKSVSMTIQMVAEGKLRGEVIYNNIGGEQYFVLCQHFKVIDCVTVHDGIRSSVEYVYDGEFKANTKSSIYKLPIDIDNVTITFENAKNFKAYNNRHELTNERIYLILNNCRFYPNVCICPRDKVFETMWTSRSGVEPMKLDGFDDYTVVGASDCILPSTNNSYSLIAYRNTSLHKVKVDDIEVFVRNGKELKYATIVANESVSINNYYNTVLYPAMPITSRAAIVSLSAPRYQSLFYGGINGWGLESITVYERLSKLNCVLHSILPHEIAHYWAACDSGVTDMKEFMLQEGVAEWSAVLYRFHCQSSVHRKHMNKMLKMHMKYMAKVESGTAKWFSQHAYEFLMFYDIFIQHGLDKVADCLRYFVYAECRSAKGMLAEASKFESDEFCCYLSGLIDKALNSAVISFTG